MVTVGIVSAQIKSTGVRAKSAIMKLTFVESLDLLVAGCEDGNICKYSLFKLGNYLSNFCLNILYSHYKIMFLL